MMKSKSEKIITNKQQRVLGGLITSPLNKMGYYSNEVIEMEERFGSILYESIKRNEYIEDVFAEMEKHRHLIGDNEEYFTEGIELAWEEYQSKYW